MKLSVAVHPWRISDGTEFAVFSNYPLAVETLRYRGWMLMAVLQPNGKWWPVDWRRVGE